MITGTSVQFAGAVAGTELVGDWRVQMTLPAGPYSDVTLSVDSISIDASTTSDMPDGTRLQVGYPAMQATVVLSGLVDQSDESKTAAWLFGPYSTTSPMYQKDALYAPVTIDLGLYTDFQAGTSTQGAGELVRKFTGLVDTYEVGDDGSVTFTCIESMRQQLRGKAQFPPLLSSPVTGDYLIDYMLRADTDQVVSSWPVQLSESLLAVGFRGAPYPEVGTLYTDFSSTYGPGVFGSALAGGTLAGNPHSGSGGPAVSPRVATEYFLSPPYVLGGGTYGGTPGTPTNSNMLCEFWVNGDFSTVFPQILLGKAPSGNLGGAWASNYIRLTVKSTGLEVSSDMFATQTWTTTVAAGPHYISWWMKNNSAAHTLNIAVQLDGSTNTFTQLAVDIGATGTIARNYVAVGWSATSGVASTIEALQIAANTSGAPINGHGIPPTTSYPFTPKAVLDPSLNSVLVIENVDGDTYSLIQQITDAELAVAGGDEAGRFQFKNRQTLASATSARDVTSASSLVSLGATQVSAASVVNHASVDWSGWVQATTASIVYQATAPIRVPAQKTITLTPTLDVPAQLYFTQGTRVDVLPDGTTTAGYWYRQSTTKAGSVTANALGTAVRQLASNKIEITLTNKTRADVWLVSSADYLDMPPGTPLLQIWGYAWTQTAGSEDVQYPFALNGGAVASRFGDQQHSTSGNPWIQDAGTAFSLATDIVIDLCNPRPDLTGVSIVPDPRLQLVDVIRLLDPDVTGIDEYARIFGWRIDWSPADYSMTVDARTLAPPGGWIMGVSGRSETGSTAYVYPSS